MSNKKQCNHVLQVQRGAWLLWKASGMGVGPGPILWVYWSNQGPPHPSHAARFRSGLSRPLPSDSIQNQNIWESWLRPEISVSSRSFKLQVLWGFSSSVLCTLTWTQNSDLLQNVHSYSDVFFLKHRVQHTHMHAHTCTVCLWVGKQCCRAGGAAHCYSTCLACSTPSSGKNKWIKKKEGFIL